MITFIIFIFILYVLFRCIHNISYNDYMIIYNFRCKLVNPQIYKLREEYKQLVNEAARSGSFSKLIQWEHDHPDFEDNPYLRTTIHEMDITLPDNGPYTNKEADKILYKKFGKYYLKTVKKVIKEYYQQTGTSRHGVINNNKEDDIIDVEFTEIN